MDIEKIKKIYKDYPIQSSITFSYGDYEYIGNYQSDIYPLSDNLFKINGVIDIMFKKHELQIIYLPEKITFKKLFDLVIKEISNLNLVRS